MKKKIIDIIPIIILVLIIVLFIMLFGYYQNRNNNPSKISKSGESDFIINTLPKPETITNKDSKNIISGEIKDKEEINSGENIIIDNQDEDIKTTSNIENINTLGESGEEEKEAEHISQTTEPKEEQKKQDQIIKSSSETSNQEKQEILNELDSALQELLDVVGKVPIVDEEKLNASLIESEAMP